MCLVEIADDMKRPSLEAKICKLIIMQGDMLELMTHNLRDARISGLSALSAPRYQAPPRAQIPVQTECEHPDHVVLKKKPSQYYKTQLHTSNSFDIP